MLPRNIDQLTYIEEPNGRFPTQAVCIILNISIKKGFIVATAISNNLAAIEKSTELEKEINQMYVNVSKNNKI